eukprot:7492483-Ditylum_brightwellii.AAC.1
MPIKLTEPSKSCAQMEQQNTKGNRKMDQRGTNNPPVVPKGDTQHQNRPNNGSKGEDFFTMEHRRSKVGPVPKDQKKLTVELANDQQTTEIWEHYKVKSSGKYSSLESYCVFQMGKEIKFQ